MDPNRLFIASILAIFSLLLAACGVNLPDHNSPTGNNPASESTVPADHLNAEESQEDSLPGITYSVTVSSQDASSGNILIDEVIAPQLSWVVIHAEDDGTPGPMIGLSQVKEGINQNISVAIDPNAATETLYAMVHVDAATLGEFEFPGDDIPIQTNGSVIMAPFKVTLSESNASTSTNEIRVVVGDGLFNEKEITAKGGTTVTWVVDASFSHTVTSDDGLFDSGTMNNGQTFSYTFNQAGEFLYHCNFHGRSGGSGMSGIITVTE